jgi:lipopolysaccharide transport system ATP-binding protein
MGILGVNGSGKSTILKIICGYLSASSGSVTASGKISAILELGTGFNRDFTGRNNVRLYASLLGLSRSRIEQVMPEIEAFAELGDFFDRPVRVYSSGMFMRLAFACTIYVDPDILVVDEALAVGDMAFQHKCIHRIRQLQEMGATVLFVSHNLAAVKSLCQSAIILESGQVICSGDAADVANTYHSLVAEQEQKKTGKTKKMASSGRPPATSGTASKPSDSKASFRNRSGSGEIYIEHVGIYDQLGQYLEAVPFGAEIAIKIRVKATCDYQSSAIGYTMRDRHGNDLMGTNTYVLGVDLPEFSGGRSYDIEFTQDIPLVFGSYSITAAVAQSPDIGEYRDWNYCDWWDNAIVFEVLPPEHGRICGTKVQLPVRCAVKKL